jgi:formamidase
VIYAGRDGAPGREEHSVASETLHISIDPFKSLVEEPETGHNRWHEGIEPILEADPGETVAIETRDALDGQLNPSSTAADLGNANLGLVHPVTGPVYVKGAEPGDLLEIKLQAIDADPWEHWGYTGVAPGFGFLRDVFPDPYLAHWHLVDDSYAESEQIPGVRIPCSPFPGIIGIAPSKEMREATVARENAVIEAGGMCMPPDAAGAVPNGTIGAEALRTVPPRENGGNMDIKQLTPGSSLFLPVQVDGALVSAGDVHYAQGDCEASGFAIEMRSILYMQFRLHKGEATRKRIRTPQFMQGEYFAPPEIAVPRRFYGTTGMPFDESGNCVSEDLTFAARNALLSMIDHLETRGYDRNQAYAICSVAVDLRISQVVDVPNFIVSALLPLDIFV